MRIDIPIYRAEAEVEGLADKIRANCSIAYHAPLQPMPDQEREYISAALAKALEEGRSIALTIGDLYPTKSILASTVWNLNDDVFDSVETWTARHTPVNKPSNVEHKEDQIVGHMTESWAIDSSGNILADDMVVSDLPNLYHLCNGAVIYTHWQKKELIERTEALIEDIEKGDKFVSMECLFSKFDYAVTNDGDFHIVARNDESAFLTKYLRAYGGSGKYEGYKIGRLLRNFTFSGKGYVDRPANPDSIIFTDAAPFNFSQANHENPFVKNAGVYLTCRHLDATQTNANTDEERYSMNELELIQSQLAEAKDALKVALESNEELKTQLSEAGTKEYEAKIADLEGQVEAATKRTDDLKKAKDDMKSKAEELEAKVEELTTANKDLTDKVEAAEAEQLRASRIATLVDGGIAKEDAEAKVEKFANLDDEQFDALASELVDAAKAKQGADASEEEEETPSEQVEASEEETDEAEANADEEVLENAEADEEVDGTAAGEGEEDEAAETRKALASFISHRLGKTTSEEEETEEE